MKFQPLVGNIKFDNKKRPFGNIKNSYLDIDISKVGEMY